MKVHIDTASAKYFTTGVPTAVIDRETKTQRVDDGGQPLFNVPVVAVSTEGPELMTIKVAGEPKGITEFTLVKVIGLVGSTWSIGDRNGMSFKAEQVQPLSNVAA